MEELAAMVFNPYVLAYLATIGGVQLDTVNDDRISIPTNTLWGEVLTSANAGARSSLCVMPFHLSPQASRQHRQQAENAI